MPVIYHLVAETTNPTILKSAFFRGPSYATLKYGKIYTEKDNQDMENVRPVDSYGSTNLFRMSQNETDKAKEELKDYLGQLGITESLSNHYESVYSDVKLTKLGKKIKKGLCRLDNKKVIFEKDDFDDQASDFLDDIDNAFDTISSGDNPLSVCFCSGLRDKATGKIHGFTRWCCVLQSKEPIEELKRKVSDLVKKGNFVELWNYFNTKGKAEDKAFILLKAQTFIGVGMLDKGRVFIPFLGNCRYGFGAGKENKPSYGLKTSDDDEDYEDIVTLSIVPTFKDAVIESALINYSFRLVGKNLQRSSSFATAHRQDSDAQEDEDKYIHSNLDEYLQANFKCVGDSRFFNEFLRICDFLNNNPNVKKVSKDEMFKFVGSDISSNDVSKLKDALSGKFFNY